MTQYMKGMPTKMNKTAAKKTISWNVASRNKAEKKVGYMEDITLSLNIAIHSVSSFLANGRTTTKRFDCILSIL